MNVIGTDFFYADKSRVWDNKIPITTGNKMCERYFEIMHISRRNWFNIRKFICMNHSVGDEYIENY